MLPLTNVAGDPEVQDQRKWKGPCKCAKTSHPEVLPGGGDPGEPEALKKAKGGVGWPNKRC